MRGRVPDIAHICRRKANDPQGEVSAVDIAAADQLFESAWIAEYDLIRCHPQHVRLVPIEELLTVLGEATEIDPVQEVPRRTRCDSRPGVLMKWMEIQSICTLKGPRLQRINICLSSQLLYPYQEHSSNIIRRGQV